MWDSINFGSEQGVSLITKELNVMRSFIRSGQVSVHILSSYFELQVINHVEIG
jgi:hypothetical protein